jgi:hypothetical protein
MAGCSGENGPALPPISEKPVQDANTSVDSNRFLWSFNEILIDPSTGQFELLPDRQVVDHWNVLKWLEQKPCKNCLKIKGITPTPKGTLQVFVEIKHPFSSLNLTGFDVRGIVMTHGTLSFPKAGLMTSTRTAGQVELMNADGYSHLYYPTTMGSGPGGLQGYIQGLRATIPYADTTLNGFKRYVTVDPANTRNAFYGGDLISQVFEIYKPSGSFILGYAVDACWVAPSETPVTDPMTDFPTEANCPEPWRIDVTEAPVGLGLTNQGGEVVLTLDIYDYQGNLSHYVPVLECPQLFDGVLYASFKSDETVFARYEATVENKKLAPNGMYKCLIKVEDAANDTAPAWLDLTAYQIHELGVGAQAPPMVTGFGVSDGDPALANRKVKLTWEKLGDTVEWYDIERLDYDWTEGWEWTPVKSAAHPDTTWTDGNARYCGPGDPIQYRISARNAAGSSPGYSTDTGYPKPRGVNMAIWCVADDAGGNGAVTPWERAKADFDNCDSFWNRYGIDFVLKNPDGFLWVGNPEYKSLTGGEPFDMHDAYGKTQHSESINVYYVYSADSDPGKAYTASMCPGFYHTTENIFIIMSKDSSGQPPNGIPVTLAHESGHAVGRFFDEYLLDSNGNLVLDDGATCQSKNTWCTVEPNTPPLFCDAAAAYAQNPDAFDKSPWNLMWYSMPGKPISDYNLYDTQFIWLHEWIHTNQNNYPWP